MSEQPTGAIRPGLIATVIEALRGAPQDLTAMSVKRAVLLLAIPMVAEMSMESLFAIVDIFFVAQLGSVAVATVGLTESLIALVYAAAVGLSAGATAMVSRRIGEGDREGAAVAAVQALGVALVAGAALGGLGAWFAPELLALMGASEEVVRVGATYTAISLGSSAVVLLLFLINAVFRGAGDASTAMRALWIANGLNIVLDPLLIFGLGPIPGMGVTGAAVATLLGRGIGVAWQLRILFAGRSQVHVTRRHLGVHRAVLARFLALSGGGTVQSLVEVASWLGLVRILAAFGSAALAGYTIAIRIAIFALLPSMGIANAAATLVGQNLGAGQPARAARSVWIAAGLNLVFLGSVSVLFVAAPGPLIGLFQPEPDAAPFAVDCLRLVALGFVFYAVGMVVVTSFNGAGDVRTPLALNLLAFWAVKLPVAWALAVPMGLGPAGVFAAIAIAYSIHAVVAALIFRRGRWQQQRV